MADSSRPSRNFGLDLVRVTEAAAIRAGRLIGSGRRDDAYRVASGAMWKALQDVDIDGMIVVGEEGRLGDATALDTGKCVGSGNGPEVDVVVDPIDGTELLIRGHPGALSLVGVAPRGSMYSPAPAVYMEKIVVDVDAAHALVPECMDAPAAWTLALVARVKRKEVRDLSVIVLDRPRHGDLIEEIRSAGARILLRDEGDAEGALVTATPGTNVDVLMGIGGVSEGVIAACAVKAMNGAMLARLAPQTEEERAGIVAAGMDPDRIFTASDLVGGNQIFFAATGITDSTLLKSVQYHGPKVETHSLLLRSETRTRRFIRMEYMLEDEVDGE
ncbi:MAG TPA: fructose-bisphosphatase class II family protein [Candidatus Binatia bacterium]|nr:fructose-bisphosphatase class II family protein [Candidatus Binatia bacterium]